MTDDPEAAGFHPALERLVRYCARPPLASGRLGRLGADTLVYRLRRPLLDGRTEIFLRPVDLLARLVDLLTPPRKHRHRYCGVLAPAARLRRAVTATAGPAGTVLQALESAREAMGLVAEAQGPRRPASRSWAMLLARIYENRPLQCPRCGGPMRIIAFILERETIKRGQSNSALMPERLRGLTATSQLSPATGFAPPKRSQGTRMFGSAPSAITGTRSILGGSAGP
jgi:hypothetical protein